MNNADDHPQVAHQGDGGPTILELDRREFLGWLGIAAGTVGVASLGGCGGSGSAPAVTRIELPRGPSQNPAYRAWRLPDGGLLLAAQTPSRTLAYGLNGNGRELWSLCDGTSTPDAIADRYATRTGRPGSEAAGFLTRMRALGVIVAGGHVVPAGRFPRPPAGGCYHTQTRPGEGEGKA